MFILKINPERCKACGLCMHFCPVGGLEYAEEFNPAGYHPARQVNPEKCTGCRQCLIMCPDVAIEMFRTAKTSDLRPQTSDAESESEGSGEGAAGKGGQQ